MNVCCLQYTFINIWTIYTSWVTENLRISDNLLIFLQLYLKQLDESNTKYSKCFNNYLVNLFWCVLHNLIPLPPHIQVTLLNPNKKIKSKPIYMQPLDFKSQ